MLRYMKPVQIADIARVLQQARPRKFVETVDLIINFKDLDFKNNPTKRLNDKLTLPFSTGATLRIGTITERTDFQLINDECTKYAMDDLRALRRKAKEAKKLFLKVDLLFATANLMPEIITNFGKVLGPLGMIPTPIPRLDQFSVLYEGSRSAINLRIKDKPYMFLVVGKANMPPTEISANVNAIIQRVASRIEGGERSIKSIYLKTTMGAPIRHHA